MLGKTCILWLVMAAAVMALPISNPALNRPLYTPQPVAEILTYQPKPISASIEHSNAAGASIDPILQPPEKIPTPHLHVLERSMRQMGMYLPVLGLSAGPILGIDALTRKNTKTPAK